MNIRAFIQVRKYCSSQMKWLFVAEKNDAAKTIAGYLSRGQSQRVSNDRDISDHKSNKQLPFSVMALQHSIKSTSLMHKFSVNSQKF